MSAIGFTKAAVPEKAPPTSATYTAAAAAAQSEQKQYWSFTHFLYD
jgi:hypothetical protein